MTTDDAKDATDETSEAVEITEPTESSEAVAESGDKPDDAKEGARKPEAPSAGRIDKRLLRGARRNFGAILVATALIISAGAAAGIYFYQYRPDQQTNAAANGALEAAKNGTVALLSYSPETLDKDFATAKAGLTGDFLSYYTQFTEQIVTPAAKEKQVKTTASVVRAAVSEVRPDSAVVLVFVNQVTTSKENPDGAFAASAVRVTLEKIDGRWLISEFEPV